MIHLYKSYVTNEKLSSDCQLLVSFCYLLHKCFGIRLKSSLKRNESTDFSLCFRMAAGEHLRFPSAKPYDVKSFTIETQIVSSTAGFFLLFVHHITHKYIRDSNRWSFNTKWAFTQYQQIARLSVCLRSVSSLSQVFKLS